MSLSLSLALFVVRHAMAMVTTLQAEARSQLTLMERDWAES